MKLYIFITFFISISTFCNSKCNNEGLFFWPENKLINTNPLIMIEGFADSQYIIENIGKRYKVYLKSRNSKIYFRVVKKNKSEYYLTQVLLKPNKKLNPNEKYQLFIQNIDNDYLKRYNSSSHKSEQVIWKTRKSKDIKKPSWIKYPREKSQIYRELGCGPESKINFLYKVKDKSDVLIEVYLKDLNLNSQRSYYVAPLTSQFFSIGHNMCSGQFRLIEGHKYQINFNILDASGNKYGSKKSKIILTKRNTLDENSLFTMP